MTVMPYFMKLPVHVGNIYNLFTVVLSVVILVASLLQNSRGEVVDAEQHHRSGLEINELRRLMLAKGTITPEVLEEFTHKYNAVLQKYSINHDPLDYWAYQIERPEEYPWIKFWIRTSIRIRVFLTNHTPTGILVVVTSIFVGLLWYGISNSTFIN